MLCQPYNSPLEEVSKTVERASVPRVRIPLSPPASPLIFQRKFCIRNFREYPGLRLGKVGASGRRERVLENDGPLWLPNSPFGNLAVRLGRPAHARATATRAASSNAFTWNEYANSDFVGPMHRNLS